MRITSSNETFANIPDDSISLEFLALSANTTNHGKLKKYFKKNIDITMDITIDIYKDGKLDVYFTVDEETNLIGDYVGACLEDVFREVTFCPASHEENASLNKGFSLEMVYHYQKDFLESKKENNDKTNLPTPPPQIMRTCNCCGSSFPMPLDHPCPLCICDFPNR